VAACQRPKLDRGRRDDEKRDRLEETAGRARALRGFFLSAPREGIGPSASRRHGVQAHPAATGPNPQRRRRAGAMRCGQCRPAQGAAQGAPQIGPAPVDCKTVAEARGSEQREARPSASISETHTVDEGRPGGCPEKASVLARTIPTAARKPGARWPSVRGACGLMAFQAPRRSIVDHAMAFPRGD